MEKKISFDKITNDFIFIDCQIPSASNKTITNSINFLDFKKKINEFKNETFVLYDLNGKSQIIKISEKFFKMKDLKYFILDGGVEEYEKHYPEKVKQEKKTTQSVLDFSNYRKDRSPTEIIKHLYVGSEDNVQEQDIEKYNFFAIINMSFESKYPSPKNVSYSRYPWRDDCNQILNPRELGTIFKIINLCIEDEKNILIHCLAGKSRSVSVIISYLIVCKGYTFDQAYELLNEKRNIDINLGLLIQLQGIKKEDFI